ncbi:winged helix-turn-helix transcriptional regulator [Nocardioides sp. NPDC058538]|uniref:winged helix-turn-helix transcriptional regulator n=1 Tax=Nocardioides sp. NPDC058538 TaxID=3346542 RepID=UPI00365AAF3A
MTIHDVQVDESSCAIFQRTLERVGQRWSGAILFAAVGGARRFGEYRRAVEGISDRMLALRLKELESDGFIVREVIPSTPVQVLYRPTPAGAELIAALQPLGEWGQKHIAELSEQETNARA